MHVIQQSPLIDDGLDVEHLNVLAVMTAPRQDARGAIGATERANTIRRIRRLACRCAEGYLKAHQPEAESE